MGGTRKLQLRVFLDDYWPAFVAAFLVIALAGGGLIYTTHVEPGTETEQQVIGQWQTEGGYSHSATVVNDTRLFATGETLREQPLYYTRVSPEIDVEFTYEFVAPEGELTVGTETRLVIQAVEDDRTFWRVEETVDASVETLSDGDEVTTSTSIDVREVLEEIGEIEEGLGASPGTTEVLVQSEVDADGEVVDRPADHQETYVLEIEPGSNTYEVEGPTDATTNHEQTRQVTVERSYGPLRSIGGPVLFAIGFLGLVGLAAGHRGNRFVVPEATRRTFEARQEREEFDDWISRVRIPEQKLAGSGIETDSLEDLVDIAIDSDRRVLEDPDRELFFLEDGDSYYTYSPPYWYDSDVLSGSKEMDSAADSENPSTVDGGISDGGDRTEAEADSGTDQPSGSDEQFN